MQIDLWHVKGSGFHFGRHGLGQEESGTHLPSDSLFAALVAGQARLGGAAAVEAWMKNFQKDLPAFVLTSAFPRAGQIRFYPKPLGPRTVESGSAHKSNGTTTGNLKQLKRIRFVSEGIFERLLAGATLAALYEPDLLIQGGHLLVGRDELRLLPNEIRKAAQWGTVWTVENRPRVTLGRMQPNSNLFFTGRTAFSPDCGLWFGVRWLHSRAELQPQIELLLADLGDAGLGGDRTSGFGRAEFCPAGIQELPDPTGRPWVTLGRYLPDPADMPALTWPRASYVVETVGGWVESPGKPAERRRSLHMLSEGSLLGPLDRTVPGLLADVQPDYNGNRPLGHEVWRNGQALAAGLTIAGEV